MEESVVDDEPVQGGGVEGSKISVSWHTAVEISMGEGSSMKGGSVDGSVLCPLSLQCHAIP